ncbi:MAG: hypothetical protein K2Q26_04140 [Bdellovibrionales bacterium]|nr:hypothetical protein [Bdellovibrionales bacterium]
MSRSLLIILISLLILSCGKSNKSSAPLAPKDLYAADIQSISNVTYYKSIPEHSYFSKAFLSVFDGRNQQVVLNYLKDRVRVALNESDLEDAKISSDRPLTFVNWLSDGLNHFNIDEEKGVTMASNIGAAYALLGQVNGTVPTLITRAGDFPLASTRAGVISLSKHYAPTYKIQGKTIPNPLLPRLSIIVHEGRHSDCTGGFSANHVAQAQVAQSIDDFLAKINAPQAQCSHMHVQCPKGSQLEGVYACDKSVWNAYGVQAIYLINATINSNMNPEEIEQIETHIGSALYRIPENFKMLMQTTSPDMSHTEF